MSHYIQCETHNAPLRTVSPQFFARLADEMEQVALPLGYVLVEDRVAPQHIYFLEYGLGSMLTVNADQEVIEVGHIGPEGASGMHVMFGISAMPGRTFMQAAGSAIRVPLVVFVNAIRKYQDARDFFLRYVYTTVLQLAQTALGNGRYGMERLARWLLGCHDRLEGDNLAVTHQFLSRMLGVSRAGVTDHLHILEGRHPICATRGNVRVLDRGVLIDIAEGCYGVPEREYEKALGRPLRVKPIAPSA